MSERFKPKKVNRNDHKKEEKQVDTLKKVAETGTLLAVATFVVKKNWKTIVKVANKLKTMA